MVLVRCHLPATMWYTNRSGSFSPYMYWTWSEDTRTGACSDGTRCVGDSCIACTHLDWCLWFISTSQSSSHISVDLGLSYWCHLT
jgi:hypothetical protein